MGERIEVGDLVMVIKPKVCCGSKHRLGETFHVVKLDFARTKCTNCGAIILEDVAVTGNMGSVKPIAIPVYRLKRIPPFETPEREESEVAA